MDEEMIDLALHENNVIGNVIDNPLILFFQEVELAIQIAPEEIYGIREGINISRYVFNKYVTLTQIKNEILNYINKNCHHAIQFNYNIEVTILKIDGKELIYIVMAVNETSFATSDEGNQQYVQKFLLGT